MIGASLAAALLVLPVAGAPRTLYDVHARTEVRYRDPGNVRVTAADLQEYEGHAFDLDVDAGIELSAVWRRARLGIGYRPRIVISSLFGDTQQSLLHEWDASATLEFQRVELSLTEHVSYGEATFNGLSQPTPDPITDTTTLQALPYSTEVNYLSTDTSLSSLIRLSRRVRLTLTMSYSMSGGTDAISRLSIPRSQGPRAVASLDYTASRRDTLSTTLEGVAVSTTYGTLEPTEPMPGVPEAEPRVSDTRLVRGGETWRRSLSRNVTATLGGGVELVFDVPEVQAAPPDGEAMPPDDDAVPANRDVVPYPFGSATISAGWAGPLHSRFLATADVGVSTVIDRITGLSDQRWHVSGDINWRKNKWALYAEASRSESVSQSDVLSVNLTALELGARYRLTRTLGLEGGARLFQQEYAIPVVGPLREQTLRWLAFVALSFNLGSREF